MPVRNSVLAADIDAAVAGVVDHVDATIHWL